MVILRKKEELFNATNGNGNLIVAGDWSAIAGEDADGKKIWWIHALGTRNERGDRLVEFRIRHDLVISYSKIIREDVNAGRY